MAAVAELEPAMSTRAACKALEANRAELYRLRAPKNPTPPPKRPRPPRSLSEPEQIRLLETLNSERFCDKAPAEVWASLLDEGEYLASERTMYRLLEKNGETKERRNQLVHPNYKRPELMAQKPNEVWSWDISKLLGPAKWNYFYLYVILDLFSRYVVGWMVAERESAALAEQLIAETVAKQNIAPRTLTVHADRGTSMRSKPVALLLADLGVTKSHSRPYTASDNPFSEAQFKTMKYRPEFPGRFGCIEDSRDFCRRFFPWYNGAHHHVGIGLMTPEAVHYGDAPAIHSARAKVLIAAHAEHPERFVNKIPTPPALPTAVWINKPAEEEVSQ